MVLTHTRKHLDQPHTASIRGYWTWKSSKWRSHKNQTHLKWLCFNGPSKLNRYPSCCGPCRMYCKFCLCGYSAIFFCVDFPFIHHVIFNRNPLWASQERRFAAAVLTQNWKEMSALLLMEKMPAKCRLRHIKIVCELKALLWNKSNKTMRKWSQLLEFVPVFVNM